MIAPEDGAFVRGDLRIEPLTNGRFELQDEGGAIDVDRADLLWLLTTGIPAALHQPQPVT